MHLDDTFISVYSVLVSFCFRTDEGMREHSVDTLYTALDEKDAVMSAKRFAKGRLVNLYRGSDSLYDCPDAFIGCVKVGRVVIDRIAIDGSVTGGRGMDFFEWIQSGAIIYLPCCQVVISYHPRPLETLKDIPICL